MSISHVSPLFFPYLFLEVANAWLLPPWINSLTFSMPLICLGGMISARGAEQRKMKRAGVEAVALVLHGWMAVEGGMRDGHALLRIQSAVFRRLNMKACLGTTFFLQPLPPFPSLHYSPFLQLFFPPRGQPHLLFSGEVKNSKLASRKPRREGEYLNMVKTKKCLWGIFRSTNQDSSLLWLGTCDCVHTQVPVCGKGWVAAVIEDGKDGGGRWKERERRSYEGLNTHFSRSKVVQCSAVCDVVKN